MKNVLIQVSRFLILIALQIFIFSQLQYKGFGMPFIYLFAILFAPLTLKKWQLLIISFATGFIIDYFTGTYGLHTIAATLIAFLKPLIIRITIPKSMENEEEIFAINSINGFQFFKFVLLSCFIFCIVFYLLDYFTISAIFRVILQVVISTITSLVLIFIYRYLFANLQTLENQ